ncbi:MAG TPA: vanadium-dependent haloperoxidase [Ginsengibacter sp.]|nr:vanadium-dependent haloperoxidase [Ginsengibacter sp.]
MKKIFVVLLVFSNTLYAKEAKPSYESMIQPAIFSITMVMIHDVVSPPVAARYYAYCMAGAYDIVAHNDASICSPAKLIPSYTPVKITSAKYDYRIAAVYCIYETGRLMLPSGFRLTDDEAKFIAQLRKDKVPQRLIDASITVGKNVAVHVIEWSKGDSYNKLSGMLHYTPLKGEGKWYPTPPTYITAVEPNWKRIRPMIIDSATQFKPVPPITFSKDSGTEFYAQAKEVYDVSKNLSKEQENIALFWDCNPFAVNTEGHMMIGYKKITPGGHWMNIAGIGATKAHLNFNQYIEVQAFVSLTLMDAFISSWDEKYRSNQIRPVTYINRYMDAKWMPILQTPPFPEYPSAHSVISAAAASVLDYMFGKDFAFTDNSEELFGLKSRDFTSFMQAAKEAGISRLYGGIHFREGVENGIKEGVNLGNFVVEKLVKEGVKPFR